MKRHLNTLFVTTQGAYLRKEGQAVVVCEGDETRLRVPVHHVGGIVCFGRVSLSPPLMGFCAEEDVAITYLSINGRFRARVQGFVPGNVLLRREQYRRADDRDASLAIAKNVVAAKIANARSVLLRGIRDHADGTREATLEDAAVHLARCSRTVEGTGDLRELRGVEGEAARKYFGAFNSLITADDVRLHINGRSRRPPLDRMNALLSFLYAILAHDVRAACEATGLDSQVGFLHRDRPGRPGLALDLMEEFRTYLVDRVALTLVNRRQVNGNDFVVSPSGAVQLEDDARKTVLTEYQTKKQEELIHPFLKEKTTVGLLPHLQARLLARVLRDEMDGYPPFIQR